GSVPPSTALPHAGHCVSGWCLWRWLACSAWPPGCPPTGECAHEAASEHDHPAHLGRPVAELAVVRGDLHRDPGLLRQGTGALDAPCPAWFIRPRQRQCTADQRLAGGQRQRAAARLLDTPANRAHALLATGMGGGRRRAARPRRARSGPRAALPDPLGGDFFFTLHSPLHAGQLGMYIVGLAGVFMLAALVSGVIIHRRIFKDFFTLRPRAQGQRAWLDAHNLFGVVGLPF